MSRRIAWILLGFVFVLFAGVARAEMVSVSIKEANLRSGPGSNHPVQWKVIQGYPLEVVKRQGNWIQVRDFEKDVSWIYAQSVNKSPYVIVTGDTVNLRATPATSARIVDKVEYGTVMERLGLQGGWVKVRIGGTTGWISANYVWGWK
ncbi:hypothetical protein CUZ56_00110 [Saezia sanguinis]|jgi:SH3-like domain-containing protein|uniref:SH3b domain-containing protein n=1 Tax=Saezia sanguinis TaxID=1965230 RepID=A0A433SFX1_9BURK|nr:SH3 domain-containing protein [Saezia sanguinis]RUS67635.1 hypothetical protein CUZ56_00110 [Saezia sanguinis]